ncbi:MAG TPA: DNRLRE domain-containing protein [Chitinophagales bacterium]|nr:DNRLRE domain-containing protein [Chitinophagales bacterium]
MKSKILLFTAFVLTLFIYQKSSAQSTTVNINLSNSVIGMERSGAPNEPAPAVPDFSAYTWTCGGTLCIGRTLMSVDLSAIPSGATIIEAKLSLYADSNCTFLGIYGEPTYGDINRGIVRRITSPWDANTVTWNNKPTTVKKNQVKIKSSTTTAQSYQNLNATALVQDMIDHPSYGIIVQMNDEVNYYKSLIFGSNLNEKEWLQPKLMVTYTINGDSQKIKPNAAAALEVEVYPNPAAENVVFEFNNMNDGDQLQLSVFTITGQLVQTVVLKDTDTYTMNLSSLNAGLYFYKAENTTTHVSYSGKFFRQ